MQQGAEGLNVQELTVFEINLTWFSSVCMILNPDSDSDSRSPVRHGQLISMLR